MNSLKYWALSIASDVFIASLFVLWKAYGVDGAGNIFIALIWLAIILGLLAGFCSDKTAFKLKRPAGFIVYHRATDFAYFCALTFYGMFTTAIFMAIAHQMLEVAREREPKAKGGEA